MTQKYMVGCTPGKWTFGVDVLLSLTEQHRLDGIQLPPRLCSVTVVEEPDEPVRINWECLATVEELKALGIPVVEGKWKP